MTCDCCGVGIGDTGTRMDRTIESVGDPLTTMREIHGNFCSRCRQFIDSAIRVNSPYLDRVCSAIQKNQWKDMTVPDYSNTNQLAKYL